MQQKDFKIVLYSPDIPGNTGSIGRTCVALGIPLILIKPLGFDLDEKSVRRAGLDYWKFVDLKIFENFNDFLENEKPDLSKLFFFSKLAKKNIFESTIVESSYLVFGSETKGLPKEIFKNYESQLFSLPMYSDKIRSLNLSNCATTVAYEALRQLNFNS